MYGNDFIKKYDTQKKFKDLDQAKRSILNFLTPYLNPQQRDFLERQIFDVKFKKFNWRINDTPE